ncbi:LytR/AlgR family response regulator transcription factor [Leeuwenhoekiella sp. W20_SRS_FM14]|uniref:LytR/AlgR family response regulator transcription factor n=1 Tax=Leeuwenhoekiella sp. W20_SRS_FM14 TaxID=3240270 RepID=UPI003F9B1AD4
MNVLVIEDEKPAARRLTRMLEALALNVQAQLNSVEEAVNWFSSNKHPDLIFLDIQLSDGLSFEIFDAVDVTSAIIFTTAYDEYALQAFKLNSIDYLLKPIDDEELEAAVTKFRKQNTTTQDVKLNFDDIRKLLGVNPVEREYKKRFTVKIGQHLKMITIEDVVCFYSENKGTYARTLDKRDYLLDTTLELLENELAPDVFFRVSRKYFVNVQAIQDIISYTNSRLQIKLKSADDLEIIVSRERVKDFKLWIS